MSDIRIERISLTLDGIPPAIASAAVEGLEAELTRRLSVRGLDAAALHGLAASVRLPTLEAGDGIDAETLRGLIADGLTAFLSPPAARPTDNEGV